MTNPQSNTTCISSMATFRIESIHQWALTRYNSRHNALVFRCYHPE